MTVPEAINEPPEFVTPPWVAMLQAHADQAEQDPCKEDQ